MNKYVWYRYLVSATLYLNTSLGNAIVIIKIWFNKTLTILLSNKMITFLKYNNVRVLL